jgi:hypothetical protein
MLTKNTATHTAVVAFLSCMVCLLSGGGFSYILTHSSVHASILHHIPHYFGAGVSCGFGKKDAVRECATMLVPINYRPCIALSIVIVTNLDETIFIEMVRRESAQWEYGIVSQRWR